MRILELSLKNYRNHNDLKIKLEGQSVTIFGPNGIGKTNILEAIHLISTVKSLRTKYDRELIHHQKDFATVSAKVIESSDDTTDTHLEIQITKNPNYQNASKKKVKIDKTPKAISKFTGKFNSVFFTPTDIEIVTGTPSLRRKYIDAILVQTNPVYKKLLSEYTQAVRQRNKILEEINEYNSGHRQIDYWTKKILDLGTQIQQNREALFGYIQTEITNYASQLNAESTKYDVIYKKNLISEERLNQYKNKEIFARKTLVGPHRDDFEVQLNEYNIETFGSRGQQRAAVLALKLCEIDFIENQTKTRPVLLLDDIFSELDDAHKEAVQNIVGLQQTIITSAEGNNKDLQFSFE